MLLWAAAVPAAAQTVCTPLSMPFSEDFDNHGPYATLPDCWVASRNYDLGPAPGLDSAQRYSGSHSLMLYSGTLAAAHYSIAISPELDLADLSGQFLRLQFYAASTSTRLEVGFCVDTGRYTRQFTPIDTLRADRPGRWQERVVDLGRYTGSGRRLAFRMQRAMQGAATQCYIDALRLGPCGTTEPTVSHLTARTLTLDWEAYGAGSVTLAYSGITVPNAVPPVNITGLAPATTYTFSVACDGGAPRQVSATTLAGPSLVPAWHEPFGAGTQAIADSTFYILPLQESVPTQALHLALRLRGSNNSRLVVGATTYPGEATSFEPVDTLVADATWQRHVVGLTSYGGSGGYIALRALGAVEVDDLRVGRCLIDSLRLYSLTESGVTLDWQALTGETNVLIEYGPPGFSPGTGTLLTATTHPYELASLAPSTQYDLLVYPACGDLPCDYDRHSITTFAHTVSAPYCTGFEAGELPLGWVCPQGSAATSTTAYQGSRSLRLASGSLVTLPMVNTGAGDSLWLEFTARGADTLTVGTMATPYSPFTPLATYVGTGWTRRTLGLSVPAGHIVAFRAGGEWHLDALALHPDAIASGGVSAITQTSARLAWTMLHGDSILLEYKAVGSATADFTPGTGTRLHAADTLLLSALTPGTHYAVHLLPLADDGNADCHYLRLNFQTAPTPITAPYCENFDALGNNAYPATWRRASTLGNYPLTNSGRNRSASRSLYFRAGARGKTVAVLPDIVSTSQHLTLAFWTNTSHNPAGTMLLVGHMSDISDYNTFVPTDTLQLGTLNAWKHHLVDLGSDHNAVALMLIGGSSESRVYLDDLCLEPCAVSDISLSNIDSTNVTLAWRSTGAAGIEVTTVGGGSTRVDTFHSSPALLRNLDTNTAYTFRFQSLCECGGVGGAYYSGHGSTGIIASDTITSITIHTQPVAVPTPYCQNFDTYTTGRFLWNWRRHGSTAATSDLNYHSGGRSMAMRNGTTLVLPPIERLSQMVATLYLAASNEAALANGALLLGTLRNRDSLSTFRVSDTLHLSRPREWQRVVASLAGVPASHRYLALRFVGGDTCTLYVDDVNVAPCGIGEASLTPEGVATWEGLHNPSDIAIEYGRHGFVPGTGTTDTVTGASTYTLTGLTPGYNYDLYLTPVCDTAVNCLPLQLSTQGPAATPYCEHFDVATLTGLPDGWSVGRTYSGSPNIAASGSNNVLQLKAQTAESNRSMAVMPTFSGGIDSLQLSLSMHSSHAGNARLVVGYVSADGDPNTFQPIDTLANSNANTWQRRIVLLPPHGGRRIALSAMAFSQTVEVRVDSVAVTRGFTPSAVPVSARMLALAWPSRSNYIEYGPAGFTQGDGTLRHSIWARDTLRNLQPGQTYWIYTHDEGSDLTCLAPLAVTMPSEEGLPYCHPTSITAQTQLPEMAIDSLQRLHLYLTLQGSAVVGAMERNGDWQSFTPVDTLTAPAGTRRLLHTSLESYSGEGRFIGLKPLGTGAVVESLTVSECQWVEATVQEDNSVMLRGDGYVEYGPAGFTPGSGTTVAVGDSLRLNTLADTTTYDYYPLCQTGATPCYAPQQWRTSLQVDIPYCATFASGLPAGWSTTSDASTGQGVRVAEGSLQLTVSGDQQVSATLPILGGDSLVVDLEVWFSATSVALAAEGQVLRAPAESWQRLRLRTGSRRPTLQATGTGTVKIRKVEATSCALPQSIAVSRRGGGHLVLNWDATGVDTPFYLEYRLDGEATGTTLAATLPPMELHLLADTHYSLYVKCDSASGTCRTPLGITTLAPPQALPYCLDGIGTTIPDGWVEMSGRGGERYLVLPLMDADSLRHLNIMFYARAQGSARTVTVGAMSDASDIGTFDSLAAFPLAARQRKHCFATLDDYYGSGRFLVLRMHSSVVVDSLSVSDCAAYGFRQGETGAEHTVISWQQQGSPEVVVEYGPTGFARGSGTTMTATASPLNIGGLDPLTDYTFYVSSLCGDSLCRPLLVDTFFTFTPKGGVGCIDYTDLRAGYVSCKYGSYDSPSQNVGVVDHGYLSAASRHTVHFDTTERDARTGGLLRTVPAGEKASVRLGNWTTGGSSEAQAESITYGMTVDSAQANLLILKYAAVLQDPEHSADLQPRFRLEILNQNDQLIDSCGLAYFVANPNLGWNTAAGEVLWKDWTTVGLDLSAYAGQTIYVRLTTYDCGEGSHFGYAYFTLECATKRMLAEGCSDVPDNRFTAPSGFNYRWYSNQSTATLSDSASIWVRSDNTMTYYCELSFVDNPTCSFTMSAFAGARYPLALFDTAVAVADCQFDLTLTNRSTISGDGITPIGTGEGCESVRWILPDSSTAQTDIVVMHLADTGLYNVTLISGIAHDQCVDTLRRAIRIVRPHPDAVIEGRSERCDNDAAEVLSVRNATAYTWSDGGSGDRAIAPQGDTTLTCYTVDRNGCRDTLTHTLAVLPTYHFTDRDSICDAVGSYRWIDTTVDYEERSGIVGRERHLRTVHGACDSLRTLQLQLMPSYDITHRDTLCHDSRMAFFDTVLTTSGSYFHADSTAFGCDSLVRQHLTIVPRVYATDRQVVCDSLVWIDGATYRQDNRSAIDTLLTPRGCDSVVSLDLTVHYSTLEVAIDTFCDGTTYLFRAHELTEGGYYDDTLATMYGCDSVLAIELTRLDMPVLTLSSDYDCDSLYHHITATSSVPYLLWSAYPDDPTLAGQELQGSVSVKPGVATTYTVYTDYAELPHCPATATLTLEPASRPEAVVKVNPGALRPQHLGFEAYDLSRDYTERSWYVDGVLQGERSRHLQGSAADGADSAVVMLVVSDGHCQDTATTVLHVLYHDIIAPNVFTPDEETNNRFYIVSRGLVRAELHIYNRYGIQVYSSTDVNQQWDGVSNRGIRCPTGNYVWRLNYSTALEPNVRYAATGNVLLLR